MAPKVTDFSFRIIGAVKAELSRRDLSGNDLVEPLGLGRNAVYDRLSYRKAFTTDQLDLIADFLGIPITVLLDSATLAQKSAA